jgi:hypothetical protein
MSTGCRHRVSESRIQVITQLSKIYVIVNFPFTPQFLSGLFASGFPTKILCSVLISTNYTTERTYTIFLVLLPNQILFE